MTRRELAKKTIGALFGVSAIPAFGQKPKPFIPPVTMGRIFMKTDYSTWEPYIVRLPRNFKPCLHGPIHLPKVTPP